MDVFLIRHAQSNMNTKPGIICGRSNHILLTEKGKEDAKRLARHLKAQNISFDKVFSSPAQRTKMTAKIVRDIMDFDDPIIHENLQELNQPEWEGKARDDAYPKDFAERLKQGDWHVKLGGGESHADVEERMHRFFSGLDMEGTIAIFSHHRPIKCFLKRALELDCATAYNLHIPPAGYVHLRYENHSWNVVTLIADDHLQQQ